MWNRQIELFCGKKMFVLGVLVLSAFFTNQALAIPIFVNEFHYDNASRDVGEAIEIAGPAGSDLSGWEIILYNGNGGKKYKTVTLSGIIPDQQSGFGTLSFSMNPIQNGGADPDGLALIDPGSTVVQFLSYEGVFTASNGLANRITSTDIGVAESSGTQIGYSLQLAGEGYEHDDFVWSNAGPATFGRINPGQTFGQVPEPGPLVLVGFGLLCVVLVRRLRHAKMENLRSTRK